MVYYTDEQRERATRTRRMNRRKRALVDSPEDARDIRNDMYRDLLGVSLTVPKVLVKPDLGGYGLPSDVAAVIRDQDYKSYQEKKAQAVDEFTWTALLLLALTVFICILVPDLILFSIFILPIVLLIIYGKKTDVKPTRTNLHTNYDKYKRDLNDYQYWERKRNVEHWNKLDGHAFEASVASLFRGIGFHATVSSRGGDGGVDIVVSRSGRNIAVQCKRYKKTVGPHVIRDLWGTMNALGYSEGCIVTTSGFSSGVKSFAENKNIHLIDLNDILRTTGEKSDQYLLSKLG